MRVKYVNSAVRILGVVLLVLCRCLASASDSPLPVPTATLELSTLLTKGNGQPTWETVTYLSESTVAIGLCRYRACSLSLIQWEGGNLTISAQTFQFKPGVSIHPASNGRLFTERSPPPTVLYSADLSRSHELATHIARVSPSGKTVSQWSHDAWKTYRLTRRLSRYGRVKEIYSPCRTNSWSFKMGRPLGPKRSMDGGWVHSLCRAWHGAM